MQLDRGNRYLLKQSFTIYLCIVYDVQIGMVTNVTKRYYFNVRYLRRTFISVTILTFGSYFSLRFVLSNFASFGSRAWDGIRIATSNSRNEEHDTWRYLTNLSKLLWKMGKKMFDVYFAESNIFRGNDNSAGMRLRHLFMRFKCHCVRKYSKSLSYILTVTADR